MDKFSLKDEIAFVTGAGSGIGQAIALEIAEAGAHVALFDLPTSEGIKETASKITAMGRKALITAGNVTELSALEAAVAHAEQDLGPLSLAVNAAGIANAAPAEEMSQSQWQKVIDVNLTGVFLSCQAEGRAMIRNGRGAIVNIASMSGTIVNRGLTQVHYNASKAGVVHLSKSLAMEWIEKGIRVNVISPGYTLTPMNLRPEVAEQRKIFERDTPIQRMATPDEMAGPAVFLLSRAASFVTGVDLLVDGGFECW
ncbi:SDR family oxidoreductase [Consotaella salsifontis]|uniref:NAD(P)-dependent dehydrogenase, short-chain alcohol dehydrogenase family n=1 Tax=Consotaella salsifontis TaxID=1365950 RepID=A0A1T4RPM3_9HYPH|nr:SDR family oxidoreductase [Consotaella salsifontis]SKA17698.1 NAD(P)-dependent dehydrogenase, short-chain alcohol dehydrogenase family [Consotaella salsifontis]